MPLNLERRILFYLDNKTLEKFISKYPIDQRNEIAKNLFVDFINGNNTTSSISTTSIKEDIANAELTIKLAKAKQAEEFESERLRKIRNENDILERQLSYHDTFDDEPSDDAKRAIRKGVEQRSINSQEYENVTKFITLRRDSLNPSLWVAKCDLCKGGETYDTRKEAIDDMVRHLTTEHAKKVMAL